MKMNYFQLILLFTAFIVCTSTRGAKRFLENSDCSCGPEIDQLHQQIQNLSSEINNVKQQLQGQDNKVAFFAKYTANEASTTAGKIIIFDDAVTNNGNGYNSSTGIFTAPTDGTYVLTWTITIHDASYLGTDLIVNNRKMASNWADTRDSTQNGEDDIASQTAVLMLKRGDNARVVARNSALLTGEDEFSTFSGWKI